MGSLTWSEEEQEVKKGLGKRLKSVIGKILMMEQNISQGFYNGREIVLDVISREKLPLRIDDDDLEEHYLLVHTRDLPLIIRTPYFIGGDSVVEASLMESAENINSVDELYKGLDRLIYYRDKLRLKGYEGESFFGHIIGFDYLIPVPRICDLEKVLRDFSFTDKYK